MGREEWARSGWPGWRRRLRRRFTMPPACACASCQCASRTCCSLKWWKRNPRPMTDLEHILPLCNELEAAGADYVLATVVAVEGSRYRRPGARMPLAPAGRRAGTVSGGCLEPEVAIRACWLTSDGAVIERYSTLVDDGDLPYGSGCGGVVYILLERRRTASPLLHALKSAWNVRKPLAIATVLAGPRIGERAFSGLPASATAIADIS